jgi:hypothetical protein
MKENAVLGPPHNIRAAMRQTLRTDNQRTNTLIRRFAMGLLVVVLVLVGVSCWTVGMSTDVPGTIHFRNGNVRECEVDLEVAVNETICDGMSFPSNRIERVEGGQ